MCVLRTLPDKMQRRCQINPETLGQGRRKSGGADVRLGYTEGMKRFFESLFSPRLKDQYLVVYQGKVIAVLSEPDVPDQFWVSFLLRPETKDEELLRILYDDQAWERELVIQEKSGRKVQFLLQIDYEEADEEVVFKNIMASRPERVTLRGPYKI